MIIFKAAERKVSKFVNGGSRTSDKLARLKYNYTLLLNISFKCENVQENLCCVVDLGWHKLCNQQLNERSRSSPKERTPKIFLW